MTEVPSPRQAALLLSRALRQVHRIQPATLRAPVTAMLEAGVEQCTIWESLLGKPVNHLLDLAHALTEDSP